MLEVKSNPIISDDIIMYGGTITTTKASLGALVAAAGIPSRKLIKGVTIAHAGGSAVDYLQIFNTDVSSTAYFNLYKGEQILIPIETLGNIEVNTASGTATFSIVAV